MIKKKRILWALILSICFVLQTLPSAVIAAEPGLVLEQVRFSDRTISKGDTFTASFVLRNNTSWSMKNIYIEIPSTDFSVVNKGSYFLAAKNLYAGEAVTVSLDLECHDMVSNRIPLSITYEDYGGVPFTLEEQLLVTFEEVTKEQQVPKLILTPQEVPSIGLGESKELGIVVKNTSEYEASKVVIRPVIAPELLSAISLNVINMSPADVSIQPGTMQLFEYKVTVNGTATPGIYPISYEIQYENKKKESFTTTLYGFIKITSDLSYSDLQVSGTEISPEVPVRNEEVTLKVMLDNKFEQEFRDLKVWIEGLPADGFVYQEDKPKKTLSKTKSKVIEITFRYYLSERVMEGNYPYEVHMTYTDPLGNSIHNKEVFGLYLGTQEGQKGSLTVAMEQLPGKPVTPEKVFPVSLRISNNGAEALEDIEVAFTGTEVLSKSLSTNTIPKLDPGESNLVEFRLVAAKQTEDINLPISFVITYDDKQGEGINLKSLNQSVSIPVISSKEIITQPKVLLSNLKHPKDIFLGEEFEMQFSLGNTNETTIIRNMKVTMSSRDAVTQSSNLIVIGQSDSIYIKELPCGGEVPAKVTLMIPNSYKNSVCDVNFNFSYEDDKGTAYSDLETIHIPVAEETALTASNVRVGNVREDGYTLELDFYNTGKGTLKNLMVDLEAEVEATNSNYYVGDLQSGRMDIYSVSVNGRIPEIIKGTMLFSYEDNGGMKKELNVPFEIHYTEPLKEPEITEENTKKASFPYFTVILAGSLVLVAVAVIRRKRKATL